MDLVGTVEVKYQGQPIHGLFHGNDFLWPDPWTDIWDEGTAIVWEQRWHDRWTPASTEEALGRKVSLNGNQ